MASAPRNDDEPTAEVDSQMPPGVVFLLTGLELVEIADSHALEPEVRFFIFHFFNNGVLAYFVCNDNGYDFWG